MTFIQLTFLSKVTYHKCIQPYEYNSKMARIMHHNYCITLNLWLITGLQKESMGFAMISDVTPSGSFWFYSQKYVHSVHVVSFSYVPFNKKNPEFFFWWLHMTNMVIRMTFTIIQHYKGIKMYNVTSDFILFFVLVPTNEYYIITITILAKFMHYNHFEFWIYALRILFYT